MHDINNAVKEEQTELIWSLRVSQDLATINLSRPKGSREVEYC